MNYYFSKYTFNVADNNSVYYLRGNYFKPLKFNISFKNKNCLERTTSASDTKDLENIIFKRKFRGFKFVFTKKKDKEIKFTVVSWFIPFHIGTTSYNFVHEDVYSKFINHYKHYT